MATTTNGFYYPGDYNKEADVPGDMKKMAESVDEKYQLVKEDITQIKNRTTTIEKQIISTNKNIDDLKTDQQSQKDALINITTEKADSLIVKDASNLNAKVKLFGISKQKTREGYNILNYDSLESRTINGITFTINEDKSITANGTATANATLNLVRRSWKLSACIRSRRLYIKWL